MSQSSKAAWQWVDPLVHDALLGVYQNAFGPGDDATAIARAHGRIWRDLLDGAQAPWGFEALISMVQTKGFDRHLVNEATAAVAVELAEVLRQRFRTSERQLYAHRDVLVTATAGLARSA